MRRRAVLAATIGAVVATALASGIAWAAIPGAGAKGDTVGAPASSAAAHATKRSASINDGLPTKWIGVTKWTAGLSGIKSWLTPATVAEVTLRLKKKGSYTNKAGSANIGKSGTFYRYVPTGKITVIGWCGKTPITVALKPFDGQLDILVPNDQGKRVRAAYVGTDNSVLSTRQPNPCPDGLNYQDGPVIAYWGFRTEFSQSVNKPSKRYRHTITTTAEMIAGTYLVNDTLGTYQPLDKYKWCFVRDRRNLGKCR